MMIENIDLILPSYLKGNVDQVEGFPAGRDVLGKRYTTYAFSAHKEYERDTLVESLEAAVVSACIVAVASKPEGNPVQSLDQAGKVTIHWRLPIAVVDGQAICRASIHYDPGLVFED